MYTLYYKIDHKHGDEHFYEDVENDAFGHSQLHLIFASMVWKEDARGIRVLKDRFGGCIRQLETEDELKEFMWIKLKSQKI